MTDLDRKRIAAVCHMETTGHAWVDGKWQLVPPAAAPAEPTLTLTVGTDVQAYDCSNMVTKEMVDSWAAVGRSDLDRSGYTPVGPSFGGTLHGVTKPAPLMPKPRQLGEFLISHDLLADGSADIFKLFEGMIVISVNDEGPWLRYTARHASFAPVLPGDKVPEYVATCHHVNGKFEYVTWEQGR